MAVKLVHHPELGELWHAAIDRDPGPHQAELFNSLSTGDYAAEGDRIDSEIAAREAELQLRAADAMCERANTMVLEASKGVMRSRIRLRSWGSRVPHQQRS